MGRVIPQPSITRADSAGFHVECPTCLLWVTVDLVEREVETGGFHSEPDMARYVAHHEAEHPAAQDE